MVEHIARLLSQARIRVAPAGADAVFIFLVLALYGSNVLPAFSFIHSTTLLGLAITGVAWVVVRGIVSIRTQAPQQPTKSQRVIGVAIRTALSLTRGTPRQSMSEDERVAVMFFAVKAFFLPVMAQFLYQNIPTVYAGVATVLSQDTLSIAGFTYGIFPLMISVMLLTDVMFFLFGYMFESPLLNNTVRSVEPTLLGWVVTLACYPPFSVGTSSVIGAYSHDIAIVSNIHLAFVLACTGTILFAIYLGATVALGTRCSNLTNRGIVTWGVYRYVRHPAYSAKVLAWWLTVLPLLSITAYVSMMLWTLLYYLRATTEERHLSRDPEYRTYVTQVPYRFIPGVY